MSDHEEEIKLLKAEIELLKNELKENKKNDDKRHKEVKRIEKEHHSENLHWNKIQALATPITMLLPLLAYFWKRPEQLPRQEKSRKKELEKKLDKIIELLENEKRPII